MANGAFTTFNTGDIINSIDSQTGTVWSNNAPRLTELYTSSVQNAQNSGQFYIHTYQTASSNATAAVQFDIAYADETGAGSLLYNALVPGKSPSSTIYGQYQNIALGDDTDPFIFGNVTGSYFYALSIERSRYKESLALGTMALKLAGFTGQLTLTDNSKISGGNVFGNAGRVYQVVSGSEGVVFTGTNSDGWTPNKGSYGLYLPDVGIILLNAAALDLAKGSGGIALGTQQNVNQNDANMGRLFTAISASILATTNLPPGGSKFRLNSQETIASDFYFVRAQSTNNLQQRIL